MRICFHTFCNRPPPGPALSPKPLWRVGDLLCKEGEKKNPLSLQRRGIGGEVQRGFVLLEVMIALVIFAISILALMDGVGNSERASGEAEKVQKAAMLARLKIAEIKLSLDEEVARGAFPDEKAESGTFSAPYEDYKWSYTIRKVEIPVVQPSSDQSQVSIGQPSSPEGASNQSAAEVLGAANSMAQMVAKKISESIREMKITISWGENEEEMQEIVITTHLAKLR